MDLKDLPTIAITLLLTGIFFIIALVILGSMQTATTQSVTVSSENITIPALYANATLAHYRVTSITSITNSTGTAIGTGNYSLNNPTLTSSKVQILDNTSLCKSGNICRINYVYTNYDSDAARAVDSAVTATTEIPSNWLLLIAVIIAASLVIGIVLNNLGKEGR